MLMKRLWMKFRTSQPRKKKLSNDILSGFPPEGVAARDLLPRVAVAGPPEPPRAQTPRHLRVPLQQQTDGGQKWGFFGG